MNSRYVVSPRRSNRILTTMLLYCKLLVLQALRQPHLNCPARTHLAVVLTLPLASQSPLALQSHPTSTTASTITLASSTTLASAVMPAPSHFYAHVRCLPHPHIRIPWLYHLRVRHHNSFKVPIAVTIGHRYSIVNVPTHPSEDLGIGRVYWAKVSKIQDLPYEDPNQHLNSPLCKKLIATSKSGLLLWKVNKYAPVDEDNRLC